MNISSILPMAGAVSGSPSVPTPDAPPAAPPARAAAPAVPTPSLPVLDVKTHYDDMSGTLVASVVNPETGAVVTEIPPEALRALAARTVEFRGKLFNLKV